MKLHFSVVYPDVWMRRTRYISGRLLFRDCSLKLLAASTENEFCLELSTQVNKMHNPLSWPCLECHCLVTCALFPLSLVCKKAAEQVSAGKQGMVYSERIITNY